MKNQKHNKLHKYNRTLCSVALSSALAVVAISSALPLQVQASDNAGVTATTGQIFYVGDTAPTTGKHFTELKAALANANAGDTIVLTSNVVTGEVGASNLQSAEGLQIPKSVTIDGQGSYTLTVRASVGKGIHMQGDLTLKNLTLSLVAERADGVIDVGGHHLTIDNVSTKISDQQPNERPTIIGGKNDDPNAHTRITIIGGSSETRFKAIYAGDEKLDTTTPVTINIQSQFAKVDDGIKLGGKGYTTTGKVTVQNHSNYLRAIDGSNSSDNHVTFSNTTTLSPVHINNIQNLTVEGSNTTLILPDSGNISGTLEVKDGASVELGNRLADEDTPITVGILKGDGSITLASTAPLTVTGNVEGNTTIKVDSTLRDDDKTFVTVNGNLGGLTVKPKYEDSTHTFERDGNSFKQKNNIDDTEEDNDSSDGNTDSSTAGNQSGNDGQGADNHEQPNDSVNTNTGTGTTDTSTSETSEEQPDSSANTDSTETDHKTEENTEDTNSENTGNSGENTDTSSSESTSPDTSTSNGNETSEGDNQTGSETTEDADKESSATTENGTDSSSTSDSTKPKDDKTENSAEDKPEQPTDPSAGNSESNVGDQSDKPTETPKEKSAEKNSKDHIMDALKGLFTKNNLTEKQQQSAVEKTEESLNDLVEMYTDYDFSFSLDAVRVAENRLNQLAMLNGLESAANDNYAFLAQSARALKTHNSIWVSSSLAEQRGDTKRRLHSINLGYDEQLGNLLFGTFVSYLHQKAERGELRSKLHGYAFSVYGKYSQDAHEVVAMLNVGRTKADLQRNISALGVSNQADAKSKFVGLKVEYGYRIPFEAYNLQVKPLVGLRYNFGRQAAFTEQGTMPVHVDQIKAQRLAVEAGVELKKYFETAYIYAKPTIQTDLMAHSNDVDVRFVDTPNSIPFKSATKKKTYFALSLGTQVQLRKNLLLDLSANNRIGHNERDIQGNIKLSYKF